MAKKKKEDQKEVKANSAPKEKKSQAAKQKSSVKEKKEKSDVKEKQAPKAKSVKKADEVPKTNGVQAEKKEEQVKNDDLKLQEKSEKFTGKKAEKPPIEEEETQEVKPRKKQEKKFKFSYTRHHVSRFTDLDIYLFREGRHFHLYDKFGAHVMEHNGKQGVYFAVWAPNAESVSVVGDFNKWGRDKDYLFHRRDASGIWEAFFEGLSAGEVYKYYVQSRWNNYGAEKADPFAFHAEVAPHTASIVCDTKFRWSDKKWMNHRMEMRDRPKATSIYEVHFGSWRRMPEENNRPLTYREMAEVLPQYVKELGFTHVEFMPIAEHPFYGSWGYQLTGYFAPTSRYGTPHDLMYLINELHREGIGVIIDWVPSHFPTDEHGLGYFDGTHLYEHADPRKGFHPDWKSYIFNYGRNEVRSFLISNAIYWLDKFHIDGLRVDAVASMLYLDYSRGTDWIPNEFGGRENIEAISFIKQFNEAVYEQFPDAVTIAEESTAWPMVSKPTFLGGLGFGMKWMMGWMHDTLGYFQKDPVYRRFNQDQLTFSIYYAFHENFMLPLSHDEVVHGKGSLIRKMPGDDWQKFANLRLLYTYMFAHPGAKLLFMGGEFGQYDEWNHDRSLDWHLLEYPLHHGLKQTVSDLNRVFKNEPGFFHFMFEGQGFEWIDLHDADNSVISFIRKSDRPEDTIAVVLNFTPVVRENYRIGIPLAGRWKEIFNSDSAHFGGSNVRNNEEMYTVQEQKHGRDQSLNVTLPPLAGVFLKYIPS